MEILESVSKEAAQRELKVVAQSLMRTPRLEQLLHYLAQHYLDGAADQLTEYNIATEVFGRKKTEFIASEDAIARVETHRLRKRLTAYYAAEGRDHAVHISIPLGGYVPHFAEQTAEQEDVFGEETAVAQRLPVEPKLWPQAQEQLSVSPSLEAAAAESSLEAAAVGNLTVETVTPAADRRRGFDLSRELPQTGRVSAWMKAPWVIGFAAVLLLAIAAGTMMLRAHGRRTDIAAAQSPSGYSVAASGMTGGVAAGALAPVAVPFRMIAGYTGAPQRDNTGDVWQADSFFEGGWPVRVSNAYIARTSNQMIFRNGREGDLSYNIPLRPGTYELHLFFMQPSETGQAEESENKTFFSVNINGALMLKNFDIVSDAMGRNVADERVFRDVSPAADGMLHVRLSTVLGTPSLSAIEILPGTPQALLPLRLVMQPSSYTDPKGQLWRPDDYYLGGRSLSHSLTETATDPEVLSFERYGHFSYALPVDPRDRYTLKLRFVELYFGTKDAASLDERRLFRVLANGQVLLDNFDIQNEAGSLHVMEKTFYHLKSTAQGKLNVEFEPVSNYATVSSIEVIDEGP